MKCSSKRRSVLALAISGLVFSGAVGCGDAEQRAQDKKVRETVEKTLLDRSVPTTQSVQKAIADLNGTVSQDAGTASNVGKIEAKSALAEAEMDAGRRAARELGRLDPQVSRVMGEIAALARQIERLNVESAAGAKAAPDATLKGISERHAAMAAAGEAATKKAGELQAAIDKIKAQVATLTQQKDAAASEADKLNDQASKANGKEASDFAGQATEARRKAGNVGHEIDRISAGLLPLERDLAVEQQKKKTADEAIAVLEANKTNADSAWQATQAKVQQQKGLASQLGQELANKAKRLDELSKQADEVRARAADQFAKSAQHSGAAANDARALASELGTWRNNFAQSPEKKAWDELESLYNMNTFRLAEAEAYAALGNLHNEHALELQARKGLAAGIATTLQTAGLAVPPSLGSGIDAEVKAALDEANKAYGTAVEKFVDASGGSKTPKEIQNSAKIARMFSLYSQYVGGDKTKLDEARKAFEEAFEGRKDEPFARALPAELREGPATPAGGGATPPAGDAATPKTAG